MSEEKTEKPTAKKRKDSRKEGQVPRTQDLGAWSTVLAFGLLAEPLGKRELQALESLMARSLRLVEDPDVTKALELLRDSLLHGLVAILALSLGALILGVLGALSQGGFYLATKAVKPKFSKLNPIAGAKRIFGLQALWEGAKVLAKTSVVTLLVYLAVKSMLPMLGGMVPPSTALGVGAGRVTSLLTNVALAALLLAGADYAFQRRKVGKQVRMTKDEVKREHKQSEGDPLLKGAIRSRQLAAARNRMMSDIGTADVLLVNPTHVAVALRYDPDAGAPTVVARGAGAVAARIRERAAEEDVPLVRDVPLARALYSSCKVGQEIPAELFAAVAQVLAFVISRRTRGHRGGAHASPRTEADLPAVSPVRGKHRREPREPSGLALAGR